MVSNNKHESTPRAIKTDDLGRAGGKERGRMQSQHHKINEMPLLTLFHETALQQLEEKASVCISRICYLSGKLGAATQETRVKQEEGKSRVDKQPLVNKPACEQDKLHTPASSITTALHCVQDVVAKTKSSPLLT